MENILTYRHRFSTVIILTKNPMLPVRLGYMELFKKLGHITESHPLFEKFKKYEFPPFLVEVSLAFWKDTARSVYEPYAPTVEERLEGIRKLREAGIQVVLRIDPLFPRSPIPGGQKLKDFGVPEVQTIEDLRHLVAFAHEVKVHHIVYSSAKIVLKRYKPMSPLMSSMKKVYETIAAPKKLDFHGGSWRLPTEVAQNLVINPFLGICDQFGMTAKYCKKNLIETP